MEPHSLKARLPRNSSTSRCRWRHQAASPNVERPTPNVERKEEERKDETSRFLPLTAVASELGRVDMVRWLLDQGADVEDVAPHEHFTPALCAAAYGKRPEVAALLIAAGANVEARDRFGNTPLANAFINCFTDPLPLAAILIQHAAEVTGSVQQLGESWNAAAFRAFLAQVARQAEPGTAADGGGM